MNKGKESERKNENNKEQKSREEEEKKKLRSLGLKAMWNLRSKIKGSYERLVAD